VGWSDNRRDTNDYDIYAQKLNVSGNLLWGSSDVRVNGWTSWGDDTEDPKLDVDSAGNSFFVWQDNRNAQRDIFAQKLDSYGNRLWGSSDLKVNSNSATVAQYYCDVAVDSSDNAISVWVDERNGATDDDIVRLFSKLCR
jgi:hypothetical protein